MNFNKYLIILSIFLLTNCSVTNYDTSKQFKVNDRFINKGFTLIYNEDLLQKK